MDEDNYDDYEWQDEDEEEPQPQEEPEPQEEPGTAKRTLLIEGPDLQN